MLIVDKKILTFDIKEVHFSDNPFDIEDCDFLTFCYCKNKVNDNGFTCQKELTSTIDLTKNLETIWQNMNRDTRRHIRRAQNNGIEVQITENYEQFFQIYRSFIQKKGINSLFDAFGVGAIPLESMKKFGTLFAIEYDGEILGGILFLEDHSNIEAWVSGSKRLEVDKKKASMISDANRLVYWEAIKYAKEKGIKKLDFGGLWPKEEAEKDTHKRGINNFKLGFSGEVVTRYSHKKIYSNGYKFIHHMYTYFKKISG